MLFRNTFFFLLFLCVCPKVFAGNLPDKEEIDSINHLSFEYKIANTSKMIKLTLENVKKAQKINYRKGMADGYFSLGLMYYYQGKYDKNEVTVWIYRSDE